MTIRYLTLLLVLAAATSAIAGDQDAGGEPRSVLATGIRMSLRMDDGARRAWAAYIAGQERLVEVAPDLVVMLEREEERPLKMPDLAIRAAALDALIRMDFRVPLDRLLPHARGKLAPAVTILVIRGHRNDTDALTRYFDAMEEEDSWNWLAVGNPLFERRAPGFARRLLSRHQTSVTVQVRDTQGTYRPPSGDVVGCGCTCRPEGYPPLVFYRLGGPPPKDWPDSLPPLLPRTFVSNGLLPVHYRRLEGDRIWLCTSHVGPSRAPRRAEWIQAMLHEDGEGPPEDGTRRGGWWRMRQPTFTLAEGPPVAFETVLRWAGTPPLLRQIGREHRALEVTYWDAARRLVRSGWLTQAEARTLEPKIRFTYRDLRREKRQPLPAIPLFPTMDPFRARPVASEGAILK
jgi:hypothetical protein